ncbi:MAG: NADH-quinone oxidoreductase subunit C [Myxococcaceae bacterium]
MTAEELQRAFAAELGEAIGPLVPAKDPFIVVRADRIRELCSFAKASPELAFDFLEDLTATDHPKEQLIRLVYHLYSYKHRHSCVLKVDLPRRDPRVATVEPIWKAANWLEREVFDLFGVTFEGHTDLRRVLLPEDWQGHPLRKDYMEHGGWHSISNVRDNPLEMYLQLDRKGKS